MEGALAELINLISSASSAGAEAGLSCLMKLSTSSRIKAKLIRLGLVQTLTTTLLKSEAAHSEVVIDKCLKLLEMVSACAQGRTAISSELEKMLKVSKSKNTTSGVRATTSNLSSTTNVRSTSTTIPVFVFLLTSVCAAASDSTDDPRVIREVVLSRSSPPGWDPWFCAASFLVLLLLLPGVLDRLRGSYEERRRREEEQLQLQLEYEEQRGRLLVEDLETLMRRQRTTLLMRQQKEMQLLLLQHEEERRRFMREQQHQQHEEQRRRLQEEQQHEEQRRRLLEEEQQQE